MLYRQVFWLKHHRSAAPSRFPSGMRQNSSITAAGPRGNQTHFPVRAQGSAPASCRYLYKYSVIIPVSQPVYTIAAGISTKIFTAHICGPTIQRPVVQRGQLLISPSLNLSCIALTARSAFSTSTSTDIFISEVVIM